MSDISNVQIGSKTYNVKDEYAREHLIDAFTDAEVEAILNFVNGLRVNGKTVISSVTATADTLEPSQAATVTVKTSTDGTASFSFGIPRGAPGNMTAFFSGTSVLFTDPSSDGASYLDRTFIIGV